MPTESTSEALVMYGFPLFWIGVGIIQWFWPAAIFVGSSNEQVTPGARGFAVFWLVLGSVLGYVFIPWLQAFSGWFIPGFVLLIVGGLQFVYPVWSISVGDYSLNMAALFPVVSGIIVLLFGLL